MLQILEKDFRKDDKKVKSEKLDKEQINPDQEDESSSRDDKSPKRSRTHSRDSRKDRRRSRRSRSRSPRPSKRSRRKSTGEWSSEGEIVDQEESGSSVIVPLKEETKNERE